MELWNFKIVPYTEEQETLLRNLSKMPARAPTIASEVTVDDPIIKNGVTLDQTLNDIDQTADRVQRILDKHKGTVILVDEAYTLPQYDTQHNPLYSKEYCELLNHYIEISSSQQT